MRLIVRMVAGLGNRMFDYTYYMFLKKQGLDVKLDYCREVKHNHEKVEWSGIFPDAPVDQASRKVIYLWGGEVTSCQIKGANTFLFHVK